MDLIRWNLLEKALVDTRAQFDEAIDMGDLNNYDFMAGTRFITGKHELYPVPAYEVRETGGVITQNPLY